MTVIDAVTYGVQALLFVVAIYVAVHTLSRPTRSNIYVLAFFALLAITIAYVWVQDILSLLPDPVGGIISPILLMTLPYVLLRLAREFSQVHHTHMRLAEIGLIGSYLLITLPGTGNPFILLALVTYFAVVCGYAAYRFHAGSINANGITQKRLRSLAWASVILGAALFTVAFSPLVGDALNNTIDLIRQGMLAASGIFYLIGFAPPRIVRQAWQEPELRNFLRDTLQMPRWSNTQEMIRHIETATAQTVGAPNAAIGLWDDEAGRINFTAYQVKPGETIGGKAFLAQRPILSRDAIADDPENQDIYEQGEAYAVLAAPITTEEARLGVIALYSPNPPIFAEDDLLLLDLLADQIAILLENRQHLEAEAEVAAREETARLKDEFLSVAAHDLKTPLTTIIASGQYLERRLSRTSDDNQASQSIQRLNREAKRLQILVQGLLDTSRIERGQLLTSPEPADLSVLTRDVLERSDAYSTHNVDAQVEDDLVGNLDSVRIQQVLENLMENARKYSPHGSTIQVRAWSEGDNLRFSVGDEGIGISQDEHEKVFDRYFRSPSSQDGAEPGIGLGLHICREIVTQHGGQIWVESTLGHGATFHVSLQRSGVTATTHDTVNSRR